MTIIVFFDMWGQRCQTVFEDDADMSEGKALAILAVNLPDFWFVYLPFVDSGW